MAQKWSQLVTVRFKSQESGVKYVQYCKTMTCAVDWLLGNPAFAISTFAVATFQGIIKRDEIVFRAARKHRIPILMVTSGGYQKRTARIIADSLLNLHHLRLIDHELAASEAGTTKVELTSKEHKEDHLASQ